MFYSFNVIVILNQFMMVTHLYKNALFSDAVGVTHKKRMQEEMEESVRGCCVALLDIYK